MIVPVATEAGTGKIISWAFLGYVSDEVDFRFTKNPAVKIFDSSGATINSKEVELHFVSLNSTFARPVVVEIKSKKILNRTEFRALCDQNPNLNVLIEALKSI